MGFDVGVGLLIAAVIAAATARSGRTARHLIEGAVGCAMCAAVVFAFMPFSDSFTEIPASLPHPTATEQTFRCNAPLAHQPNVFSYSYVSEPICTDDAHYRRQLAGVALVTGAAGLALGVWGRRRSASLQSLLV